MHSDDAITSRRKIIPQWVNSDELFKRTDSPKRVRLPLRLRPLALLLSARQNQSEMAIGLFTCQSLRKN